MASIQCRATGALHTHESVADVKDCFAYEAYCNSPEAEADARAEAEAEMAYERHLEDRGWMEAAAFEEWEASRGVIPFHVAAEMADARLRAEVGNAAADTLQRFRAAATR
jgi:hypothetical protein